VLKCQLSDVVTSYTMNYSNNEELLFAANSRIVVEALHQQFNLMSVLANYLRLQLASTSDGNVFQVKSCSFTSV